MSETLKVVIVGSGPAALYAAAELAKYREPSIRVNMIDRLPCIGGLVRSGVAPDHYDRRLVIDAYEKLARSGGQFEFFGNVEVGHHVTHNELLVHHHAVIYAIGASGSQPLDIPGADLPGCHSANEFVGWYNGHPDHAGLDVDLDCKRAVIIGNGNVALDIARVLLKSNAELLSTDTADHARDALSLSRITDVVVIGRRGAVQASFTYPELHELGTLTDVGVHVDQSDLDASEWPTNSFNMTMRRKCLAQYTASANDAKKHLRFRFLSSPVSIHGESHVAGLDIMRNRLELTSEGHTNAVATGHTEELATGLIVHAIGYRAVPPANLPFDIASGTVPNEGGRVNAGAYVTGWIKRGPRGVIGSNKGCAAETVKSLLADAAAGRLHRPQEDKQQFIEFLYGRQPDTVDYRGWKAIDRHEKANATNHAPRRKLCSATEMIGIANKSR